jgi:hypothetical protein
MSLSLYQMVSHLSREELYDDLVLLIDLSLSTDDNQLFSPSPLNEQIEILTLYGDALRQLERYTASAKVRVSLFSIYHYCNRLIIAFYLL